MGTGALERFADKAKNISNACLAHVLEFLDDGKVLKITVGDITPDETVGDITPDEENQLLQKKIELGSHALGRKGLYAFIDQDDKICYIGQGGEGASTTLRNRILQELRLYRKTPKGATGARSAKTFRRSMGSNLPTTKHFGSTLPDGRYESCMLMAFRRAPNSSKRF